MEKPTSAGTLDPTFNKHGVLYFTIPGVFGRPDALLALPDKKTLIVRGSVSEKDGFMLGRLNEDGSPDPTFGPSHNGFIKLHVVNKEISLHGLSLLSNGGWLIFSSYFESFDNNGLLVVRMLSDGSLDESLNGTGQLLIPYRDLKNSTYPDIRIDCSNLKSESTPDAELQAARAAAAAVIQQSDGKFVLITSTGVNGKEQGIVLRRNFDGSSDETFNGGFSIIDLPGIEHAWNRLHAVAIQAEGEVLVTGLYRPDGSSSERGAFVTRLTSTGQIDNGFNNGAPVVVPNDDWAEFNDISIGGNDDKIVVVGHVRRDRNPNGLIIVLEKNGSYHSPFNNGEPLFSKLGRKGEGWVRGVFQPDGSILVSGTTGTYLDAMTAVTARYLPDGKIDTAFNSGAGFTVFDDGRGSESTQDMAVMTDGRILVCGHFWNVQDDGWNKVDGGWVVRYIS